MGRTIPSFRIALAAEEARWKSFRSALDKQERKVFDRIFLCARLYLAASTCAARPVPVHAAMISIAFHHQKRLETLRAAATRGGGA
jgi:hypothetical protein